MNKIQFKQKLDEYRLMAERNLYSAYPLIDDEYRIISEAARYSLLAGGKRIRPALCFAVSDMICLSPSNVMVFACAIEMIHTYSLIHDDLPCIDNDDIRRGKKTSHKVFGEAIALLAGDALLNKAYENMMTECLYKSDCGYLAAMKYLSDAAGDHGMIGGQVLDLLSEKKEISLEQLQKIHAMKTGAIIRAAIMMPVLIAKIEGPIYDALESYASVIGMIFQIQDDILDVTASSEALGKTAGKDKKYNKATYVSLLGLEEAGIQLKKTGNRALIELKKMDLMGYPVDFLQELTYYLLERKN
jgi:geranylgeranyl diphosphate synthase, type II